MSQSQRETAISKFFSGHFCTILNVGIVLCTFVESYMFPFAIIKWMIIVAKYRDIGTLIKSYISPPNTPSRFRYNYTLELMTACKNYNIEQADVLRIESHVSVVMESEAGEPYDFIQLTYCGQDCQRIPPALWKMYGAKVRYLDLSFNSIETLRGFEHFPRLDELILDNNKLNDGVTFPLLPHLKTLSINNNQISDLEGLVNKISECFPSLSYLSLLSNKACPNQLSDLDKDESDYQRYRYYVIHKLRSLRFLDSRRVGTAERAEAATRGEFMRVRRPRPEADAAPALPVARERPLPVDLSALGKHKGAYGKCNYKYTGKHSEGNRFIKNSDL
ncbi:leucine-rich melanocyte differentiation-associated protein-like isoform X1 [Choristoneura fumiferana]|uniref:leucine-rich melanocyte differentiation-associated protein-like isoform X1 n=1 Tax=Choristoneura fumiferana TaxID=7141 RepID=UPI003D15E6FB